MSGGIHLLVLGSVAREHVEQTRLALGLIAGRLGEYFSNADHCAVNAIGTLFDSHDDLSAIVSQWAEDHKLSHHVLPSIEFLGTDQGPATVFFGASEHLESTIPHYLRTPGEAVVVDPVGMTIQPWVRAPSMSASSG